MRLLQVILVPSRKEVPAFGTVALQKARTALHQQVGHLLSLTTFKSRVPARDRDFQHRQSPQLLADLVLATVEAAHHRDAPLDPA